MVGFWIITCNILSRYPEYVHPSVHCILIKQLLCARHPALNFLVMALFLVNNRLIYEAQSSQDTISGGENVISLDFKAVMLEPSGHEIESCL